LGISIFKEIPRRFNCFFQKGASFLKISAKLPPGHPEGMFDSMANIYNGVAREIRGEKEFDGEYPTLNDGLRGMLFIEKAVESHHKGNTWIKL